MIEREIAQIAQALGDDRYSIWLECGAHDWRALPVTTDTGEHYCLNCGTLFSPDGAVLNQPTRIWELMSTRRHGVGEIVARVFRGREARADFFHYEFDLPAPLNRLPFIAVRSATKSQAQARADAWLQEQGHDCSVIGCGDWN